MYYQNDNEFDKTLLYQSFALGLIKHLDTLQIDNTLIKGVDFLKDFPKVTDLNYNNLNSHLLIIIRYFGGTKLGAGNLLRTYLEVAKNTVKKITN